MQRSVKYNLMGWKIIRVSIHLQNLEKGLFEVTMHTNMFTDILNVNVFVPVVTKTEHPG